MMNDDILITDR